MSKRVFIWGLIIWVGLLCLGLNWCLKPYVTPLPGSLDQRKAVEGRFVLRLAKLDNSSLTTHSDRLSSEVTTPPPQFDYADWMWREARNRACVFLVIYLIAGGSLHWLVGQIHRDKIWLG